MTFHFPPSRDHLAELKDFRRRFYSFLADDYDVAELRFMNYGFVPTDGPEDAIKLDESEERYRYQIQLYDHLARLVNVEGKNVLEVGCGRGGGASYIAGRLRPKSYTGLDLTKRAVQYGAGNNKHANLRFLAGDAEHLPFREGAFDVVINVESCHCYDPIENFLAGVRRVLVPGGYLLLTDFRDLMRLDDLRRSLFRCGLTVLEEKNITKNVFEAVKRESKTRLEAIVRLTPQYLWPALREFGAVSGSGIYHELENGGAKYMSYVLQKP